MDSTPIDYYAPQFELVSSIGKFGIIFDTRPCEINDLAVSSRQCPINAHTSLQALTSSMLSHLLFKCQISLPQLLVDSTLAYTMLSKEISIYCMKSIHNNDGKHA